MIKSKISILLIIILILVIYFVSGSIPFWGQWHGGKWTCEKPLEISAISLYGPASLGGGIKFNEQHDALLLGPSGPFLVANQDGTRLTYSEPNGDGQTFDLVRCK